MKVLLWFTCGNITNPLQNPSSDVGGSDFLVLNEATNRIRALAALAWEEATALLVLSGAAVT